MITTSQAWKDYSRDTGIFHIRATMTGSSTVNLTDSDFMMGSVSFTDSISGMNEITFGSVVTNTFTATLVNTDGRFDNWRWNRISVEFGYGNEWISRGVYNIDRPETIGSTVKIECYDDMDKLNQYFKGFITQTFPVTYKALIQAICTACGVTFGTWASGIPNTNVTALVASAFNESTTCRQVVSWILEVCGAYARINPVTHQLDCKVWNSTGGYNLTGVKDQSIYIDDVTITGVRAYTYNTNDEYDYATAGTDGYVVYIMDNPFVSATNKADIAAQALTNGGGGSVRPFTATIFGDPAMEAGDIVTFTDRRNNTYTSVITSLTYNLNGTMRVSCDAKTPQDNSLDYSNPYDSAVWASILATDELIPSVNLFPNPYYSEYTHGTVWENSGVEWTLNKDGSVTANGTASASENSWYYLSGSALDRNVPCITLDPTKRYFASGCPSGGSSTKYGLLLQVTLTDDTQQVVNDYGDGVLLPANSHYVYSLMFVYKGFSVDHITFYPLLEVGTTRHAYVSSRGNIVAYTQTQLSNLQDELETQIDAKVETWAQSTNPATAWTTADLKAQHNGDLWYYTGTSNLMVGSVTIQPSKTYQYNGTNNTWSAYNNPSESLYDFADGKSTIYYGTTSTVTSADDGDFLVDKTSGATYRRQNNAWVEQIASPVVNLMPSIYYTEYDANSSSTYVHNGITYTLNKDGSVTANGTPTSSNNSWYNLSGYSLTSATAVITLNPNNTYILHGCPSGGDPTTYNIQARCNMSGETPTGNTGTVVRDTGNGVTLPAGTKYAYIYIYIYNATGTVSNLTFYPMLEVGTVKHNFVSNRSNTTGYTEKQVAPFVQNLMPSTYYSTKRYGTEFTGAGIKWTTNADGTVTASSQSGTYPVTASSATTFTICANNLTDTYVPIIQVDPSQSYIIHGCPEGGSSTTYRIRARCTQSGTTPSGSTGTLGDDTGNGYTIPTGTKYVSIYIQILSGATLTQAVTFRPMLEVGTIKHSYVSSQQSQENTFNKLTNYGSLQGLYMDGGDMYVNATYIKTGSLEAERIGNGTIGSAITASNLTMTGGSVNITTSDQALDIIKFNYNDASSTWKDSIDIRTNYLELSTLQGTVSPSTTWKQCGIAMSADHNASGGSTRFAVTNDDSTNGTLEVLGAVAYAGGSGTVTIMGESLKDFVIEQGTSGVWRYRKWYSGIAECWGTLTQNVTSWTAWGSLYEAKPAAQGTYPSELFNATPTITASPRGSQGLCGLEYYTGASSTTTPYLYCLRPSAGNNGTYYIDVQVKGKWK